MSTQPESGYALEIPEFTIGDRLRKIRRHLKMGQEDFAAALGVKPSTYMAWETGRNAVTGEVAIAKRVRALCGIPEWWTLGIDESPRPIGPGGGEGAPSRARTEDLRIIRSDAWCELAVAS